MSRKRAGEKRKRNNWGLTCARNVKIKEIKIFKKGKKKGKKGKGRSCRIRDWGGKKREKKNSV